MEEHELPEKLRGMGLEKADGTKKTISLSYSKVVVFAKIFADMETRQGEKGAPKEESHGKRTISRSKKEIIAPSIS